MTMTFEEIARLIWLYMGRKDMPHHYKLSAYRELVAALPTLTFEQVNSILGPAPLPAQLDLWGKWLNQADLTRYSRNKMARMIDGLPKSVEQLIAQHYNDQNGKGYVSSIQDRQPSTH